MSIPPLPLLQPVHTSVIISIVYLSYCLFPWWHSIILYSKFLVKTLKQQENSTCKHPIEKLKWEETIKMQLVHSTGTLSLTKWAGSNFSKNPGYPIIWTSMAAKVFPVKIKKKKKKATWKKGSSESLTQRTDYEAQL